MDGYARVGAQRVSFASLGALALAAGLAVYAALRPVRIPLIPAAVHLEAAGMPTLGVMGALPSAIHAFAMPMLTLACWRAVRRSHVIAACATWAAVDVVFELAQRQPTRFLPAGTFDPLDLCAALVGAALAGVVAFALIRSTP